MYRYVKIILLMVVGFAVILSFLAIGVVALLSVLIIFPLLKYMRSSQDKEVKPRRHHTSQESESATYIETEYHEIHTKKDDS